MSASDHVSRQQTGGSDFSKFLPNLPAPVDAYDEEMLNAVRRRISEVEAAGPDENGGYRFSGGPGGPLGPLDADYIEQTRQLAEGLSRSGFPVTAPGKHPRGIEIDTGVPDVLVTATIRPSTNSLNVSVHHLDQFKTDESGNYVHPEGWGQHDADIPLDSQLPGRLLDHLSSPEVRRHMFPPKL